MVAPPLPSNFYVPSAWYQALFRHYGNSLLPPPALEKPLRGLTHSVAAVIDIYGNFPGDTFEMLYHAANPLLSPEFYKKENYERLMKGAEEENDHRLQIMAEALYYIRRFFSQDEEFIKTYFSKEVGFSGGTSDEENYKKFAAAMQRITKNHITQVCKMIKQHGV